MDDALDHFMMPKTVSSLWRDLVGSVLPLQWNASRHKCKSWSMVGAVLLVPVGRDRYALILAGLVMRMSMVVCALSFLSSPTPGTQFSGGVPHV